MNARHLLAAATVAALTAPVALGAASAATAKKRPVRAKVTRACAFRAVPCPALRVKPVDFYGPYTDVTTRRSIFNVEIRNFSGPKGSAVTRRLRKRKGATVQVRVTKATRLFVVRPDHSRGRVRPRALFTALDNYERAPVYVSGRLYPKIFWEDLDLRLSATLITLDLSDGAVANLNGEWHVQQDPNLRVVLKSAVGLRRYSGEIFGPDGAKVATVNVTQPTTGTACLVDWVNLAVAAVPAQFDCGPISNAARSLGPMAPRTPGATPVTLIR